MNEYRIKDIPPRGDIGYRIEALEYDRYFANPDDPEAAKIPTEHDYYFFAQRPVLARLDKSVTRFGDYKYTAPSGLDFEGTILFPRYSYALDEEKLLYATFHVVDLGSSLEERQVKSVQVTQMLEFKNGVSRNFPMKNEALATAEDPYSVKVYSSHYYYIFFNVYEIENDESSIVYSSGEDYRLTGYNPIVIYRVILDIVGVPEIESNRAWFRIKDIVNNDKSEDDPSAVYQITVIANPV